MADNPKDSINLFCHFSTNKVAHDFLQVCDLEVGASRPDPISAFATQGNWLPEYTSLLFRAAGGGGGTSTFSWWCRCVSLCATRTFLRYASTRPIPRHQAIDVKKTQNRWCHGGTLHHNMYYGNNVLCRSGSFHGCKYKYHLWRGYLSW